MSRLEALLPEEHQLIFISLLMVARMRDFSMLRLLNLNPSEFSSPLQKPNTNTMPW